MIIIQIVLIVSFAFNSVLSQTCPKAYMRFSTDHSFCRPKNPTCNIRQSGVSQQDRDRIVREHNQYRSRVATGQEKLAGGLPSATNMMQMVWDDELAAIAQKWAQNCVYEHDCNECREVENFSVGQNIAYREYTCNNMATCITEANTPQWTEVIKSLYDEVADWNKNLRPSYQKTVKKTGHFTQMIWAKTWRIGCGYVQYDSGKAIRQFYVCNYGPAGNTKKKPIYQAGHSCSACPSNSCCGDSCKGRANTYPGLCHKLEEDTAPIYPTKTSDLFFNCDFSKGNEDCHAQISGTKKWKTKNTLEGPVSSVEVNGGESVSMSFHTELKPTESFCVRIIFRKSSMLAGNEDSSSLTLNLEPHGFSPKNMPLKVSSGDFTPYSINLGWKSATKFGFTFEVPQGVTAHALDIKQIMGFNGKCSSRTDE